MRLDACLTLALLEEVEEGLLGDKVSGGEFLDVTHGPLYLRSSTFFGRSFGMALGLLFDVWLPRASFILFYIPCNLA